MGSRSQWYTRHPEYFLHCTLVFRIGVLLTYSGKHLIMHTVGYKQ